MKYISSQQSLKTLTGLEGVTVVVGVGVGVGHTALPVLIVRQVTQSTNSELIEINS